MASEKVYAVASDLLYVLLHIKENSEEMRYMRTYDDDYLLGHCLPMNMEKGT